MNDSYETHRPKLIGYIRVSTKGQDLERQHKDMMKALVRPEDVYVDHGVSGARADRPGLTAAMKALQNGDTLIVTTLDRLGRSTVDMMHLAREIQAKGAALKVLNLGGASMDTKTPIGQMIFTVMAALAEMELEIKKERIRDSVAKRRAAGHNLGGRRQEFSDALITIMEEQVKKGRPVKSVCEDFKISRATYYRRLEEIKSRPEPVRQTWRRFVD